MIIISSVHNRNSTIHSIWDISHPFHLDIAPFPQNSLEKQNNSVHESFWRCDGRSLFSLIITLP